MPEGQKSVLAESPQVICIDELERFEKWFKNQWGIVDAESATYKTQLLAWRAAIKDKK
jgi:hypothetical protein